MAASINHLAASTGDKPGKGKHLNNINEPLQRFKEAKACMGEIYKDLYGFVNELSTFYSGLDESSQKFVPSQQKTEVTRFKESIRAIKEMVGRDKMKVVFFGRTSNGKSSVVNAMLGSKILPQGMGHTTCCFLQVEGGQENEKYFTMEDDETKYPLEKLQSVGDALVFEGGTLGKDSLIRISYPKSGSKLLQNDVVIVDSPGIDLSPEFDSWIDKHCLDADVFVLVCNSEATLTQAEKNFFIRVSKKLSRPNIFILCNRWDASATESDEVQKQIRGQHEKRFVNFLSAELKVCTTQEANNRFFFISAREMMDMRLKERGQLMTTGYQMDGFQRRALEFKNFEEQFEKCISKSAIRTKFEAHNRSGREMVSAIQDNLDTTMNAATQEKKKLALDYKLKVNHLTAGKENFKLFERTYNEQQRKLRARVHMKVSADFIEEIARLEAIIDRFKHPFGDDQATIEEYKMELANYVNNLVTEELQNQCTAGLMSDIWALENSMHSYVKQILDEPHAVELDRIWRYRQPFKFVVTVNCPQLVADFHEDLEFRFSLGPENIARWILSVTKGQPITSIDRNILRLSPTSNPPGAGRIAGQPNKQEVDVFLSNVVVQSASYLVNGSVGLTIAGLVIYKNLGWKWIMLTTGGLAALYGFERLRWDSGAKEERLKNQFRQHLEQRLHQCESIHTAQCEQQLIRELNQVYEGLCTVVSGYHQEMKEDVDKTKKNMDKLESTVSSISTIKNKITFMNHEQRIGVICVQIFEWRKFSLMKYFFLLGVLLNLLTIKFEKYPMIFFYSLN